MKKEVQKKDPTTQKGVGSCGTISKLQDTNIEKENSSFNQRYMAGGPRALKGGSLWFFKACGVQCLALQEPKVVALAMVFRKGRRIERKKKMCLREDDEEEESFLNKEGGD